MANYDKTFTTICRVCLDHDKEENMVSLTFNTSTDGLSQWGLLFEKFTKIAVKQNDYLPTKICHNCKKSLLEVSMFISRSEMSDRKLSKLVSFSLKQDLTGEMVKEVVCQYTLFCKYFPEESKPSNSRDNSSSPDNVLKMFSEEKKPKIEGQPLDINVKIEPLDYPENLSDSDEGSCQNHSTTEVTDCDNVDIFLDSIEKLVSSKIKPDDRRQRKKELKQKESVRNLTCNICFKTLANPATYDYHMQRHGVCRYICDQCGKGFPVLAEMNLHQVYRHGIGPCLECDYCSFKAGKRLELIEHIRLHTGERPFTCEKCGLNFRRKAIYRNHLKCHNEKTVPCNYCPRKFYRRSEMLAHSNNIHDRMYLYLCKVCNVTYAKAQTVRKHMVIKHGIPREMQGKIVRINKNVNSTLFKDNKNGEQDFPVM